MAEANNDTAEVLRRIRRISAGAYVLFTIPVLITSGLHGFVGLTCGAVVTMISFLWLEQIVNAVLQPSPRLRPWKFPVRALGRYALLGAALAIAILVARFNAVSVLLGFSIVVVGIIGEALYSNYKGLDASS
ncbi:MAG TPA: ATP synthase subunit I [Thermoanaerobaculia bacterium]